MAGQRAYTARTRIANTVMHASAHLDAEVLSALARLHRADRRITAEIHDALLHLAAMPLRRHPIPELLPGAWSRRDNVRMAEALYVELATRLGLTLITIDDRLARACTVAEAATT